MEIINISTTEIGYDMSINNGDGIHNPIIFNFNQDFSDYHCHFEVKLDSLYFSVILHEYLDESTDIFDRDFSKLKFKNFLSDSVLFSFHVDDLDTYKEYHSKEIYSDEVDIDHDGLYSFKLILNHLVQGQKEFDMFCKWFKLIAFTINHKNINGSQLFGPDFQFLIREYQEFDIDDYTDMEWHI